MKIDRHIRWVMIAIGAIGSVHLSGCGKKQTPAVTAAAAPATRPSPSMIPLPPTTAPAEISLIIDDSPSRFPQVRLLLEKDASGVTAQLYTLDDPEKQATENRIYIVARLTTVTEEESSMRGLWRFRSPDDERGEPPRGIFLAGGLILQPEDVTFDFQTNGPTALCKISGKFIVFKGDDDKNSGTIEAHGTFTAGVDQISADKNN